MALIFELMNNTLRTSICRGGGSGRENLEVSGTQA
jgi:hypothetical protein